MENKKENKDGKMTIDKLASMVARGFEKTPTKDEMNSRFDAVDQRLGKVEYRIDEIHETLTRLEEDDILGLQKRVKNLEHGIKILNKQI